MLFSWQRDWVNWTTSLAPLALIAAGLYLQLSRGGWITLLLCLAVLNVSSWIANYRRYRLIHDTPTSSISSAAQGYVELCGTAHPYPGILTYSPRHNLPCAWYKYRIEKPLHSNDFFPLWIPIEHQTSSNPFLLKDESGECVIDPEQAECFLPKGESWLDEDGYRHTEWLLLKSQPLYVLGEFITHNSSAPAAQQKRELLAKKLNAWKKDPKRLLARFDANQDGEIDEQEWGGVRAAAEVAVLREQREQPSDLHLIQKPSHGQPFVLARDNPQNLANRLLLWANIQLVFLASTLSGLGFLTT